MTNRWNKMKPSQEIPFPENPFSQVHEKLPIVLLQYAWEWQSSEPNKHSFISNSFFCYSFFYFYWLINFSIPF